MKNWFLFFHHASGGPNQANGFSWETSERQEPNRQLKVHVKGNATDEQLMRLSAASLASSAKAKRKPAVALFTGIICAASPNKLSDCNRAFEGSFSNTSSEDFLKTPCKRNPPTLFVTPTHYRAFLKRLRPGESPHSHSRRSPTNEAHLWSI